MNQSRKMKKKEAGTLTLKQDPSTASLISQSFFCYSGVLFLLLASVRLFVCVC